MFLKLASRISTATIWANDCAKRACRASLGRVTGFFSCVAVAGRGVLPFFPPRLGATLPGASSFFAFPKIIRTLPHAMVHPAVRHTVFRAGGSLLRDDIRSHAVDAQQHDRVGAVDGDQSVRAEVGDVDAGGEVAAVMPSARRCRAGPGRRSDWRRTRVMMSLPKPAAEHEHVVAGAAVHESLPAPPISVSAPPPPLARRLPAAHR